MTCRWLIFVCCVWMAVGVQAATESDQRSFTAGVHAVSSDTIFTEPVIFEPGAVLDIPADVTVTFTKNFQAEDELIFAGKGKVAGVSRLMPEWFGAVGDGVTDDTAAIQRALDCFIDPGFGHTSPKVNNVLLLRRNYLVSSLTVNATYTNIHAENAWLIAKEEGNYPHLIRFNRHFSSITGRLSIEGNYNLGYECMIHINTRHFVGNNIVIWRASLAWLVGDREWATSNEPGAGEKGDSENMVSNSSTPHCLRGVEAVGSNTIITFANCFIYSYPWTLPADSPRKAAWESADPTLVRTIGACIYFTGGGLANFNSKVPLVEIQPIKTTKPQYFSNYGVVRIFNAHVEGGNILATKNPRKIPTQDHLGNKVKQVGVSFSMVSCGGYVGGTTVPFKTDPMFTGTILVQNSTFHGDRGEIFAEIGNPEAVVKIDSFSLRDKWSPGLNVIKGGMLLFENRLILDVRGSGKATTGTTDNIIFTRRTETDDTGHFKDYYNERNGQFTVPEGGLTNVQIVSAVEYQADDDEQSTYLEVVRNGKIIAIERGQGPIGTIRAMIPTLDAGDVIGIRTRSSDGKSSLKIIDGDLTYLQIIASRL